MHTAHYARLFIFIGFLAHTIFGTFLEDADGCDAEKGTSRK